MVHRLHPQLFEHRAVEVQPVVFDMVPVDADRVFPCLVRDRELTGSQPVEDTIAQPLADAGGMMVQNSG